MHAVFTKPLDALTAADVDDLCAKRVLESPTVEFKQALSAKGGRDKWHSGAASVGDHARNELLSEAIAFANSDGGTLIVGIQEMAGNPPSAEVVDPVPRCHDLAQRLENMASACIDPPLPMLHLRAIETDGVGGGVIVWRIARSRRAPHRLTSTLECYVRRGSACQRMGMREIQELTLRTASSAEAIERRLGERRRLFEDWVLAGAIGPTSAVGCRVTALPMSPLPSVGRIHGREGILRPWTEFKARIGRAPLMLNFPAGGPGTSRPILRGTRSERADTPFSCRMDLLESGLVDFWLRVAGTVPDQKTGLWITSIAWAVANAVLALDHFRLSVGVPEVEYGMEVQGVACSHYPPQPKAVPLIPLFLRYAPDDARIHVSPGPLMLPLYPVNSSSEFDDLMHLVVRDILDAAHVPLPPDRLTVEW